MPILIDKVLSALAYPLGLAVLCMLVSLAFQMTRVRRTAAAFTLAALLVLWGASTQSAARYALNSLEAQYPAMKVEDYPTVDVAIVLGGSVGLASAKNPYPDLGGAGDRVLHAYRIFKAGKASKILLSGGLTFDPHASYAEADAMADLLVSLGIDRSQLIIENRSGTTRENAEYTFKIWQDQRFGSGLLVTSASHMPRALAVFRASGMKLEPAVTDVMAPGDLPPFPLSFLPDASFLAMTTLAIKEWLGLVVYRWRGWA